MRRYRAVSIAVMLLLLGMTLSAFADKDKDSKDRDDKDKHGQHQGPQKHEEKKGHEESRKDERQIVAHDHQDNDIHHGRISDAHYRDHFGHDHAFHMVRRERINGFYRFQYGGYSFGYNERWPDSWRPDDDVFIVYEHGGYFMYNARRPGIHLSLHIF